MELNDILSSLSLYGNILFKKISKDTLNDCFIIYQNGISKYFLKNCSEKHVEKEIFVSNFFNKNNLLKTPKILFKGKDFIISEYLNESKECHPYEFFEDLISFHKKSLKFEYDSFLGEEFFVNERRKKGIKRIQKYKEIIKNLWENDKELISFIEENSPDNFNLSKILVHGDLNHSNVLKNKDGQLYFIDFEYSFFDYVSWDLSKIILDFYPKDVNGFLEKYISRIEGKEDSLKKAIHSDFILRTCNDSISMQTHPKFSKYKNNFSLYLNHYKIHLENILRK